MATKTVLPKLIHELQGQVSEMSWGKWVSVRCLDGYYIFLTLDTTITAPVFEITPPGGGSPLIRFREIPNDEDLCWALALFHGLDDPDHIGIIGPFI